MSYISPFYQTHSKTVANAMQYKKSICIQQTINVSTITFVVYDVKAFLKYSSKWGYHNRKTMSWNTAINPIVDFANTPAIEVKAELMEIEMNEPRQWVFTTDNTNVQQTLDKIYIYEDAGYETEIYDSLLVKGYMVIFHPDADEIF